MLHHAQRRPEEAKQQTGCEPSSKWFVPVPTIQRLGTGRSHFSYVHSVPFQPTRTAGKKQQNMGRETINAMASNRGRARGRSHMPGKHGTTELP